MEIQAALHWLTRLMALSIEGCADTVNGRSYGRKLLLAGIEPKSSESFGLSYISVLNHMYRFLDLTKLKKKYFGGVLFVDF